VATAQADIAAGGFEAAGVSRTFRALTSSWYTVPVLYVWNDLVAVGGLKGSEAEFEAVTE